MGNACLCAATVTFSRPATIAGDSDVLTTGTLVCAFSLGGTGQTVNNVVFAAANGGAGSPRIDLGNVSIAAGQDANSAVAVADNPTFAGDGAAYNSLSPAYKSLLGAAYYNNSSKGTLVVTFVGLSTGTTYVAQFFVNDSRGSGRTATATSGGAASAPLIYDSDGAPGGVGQWLTATFTADAPTQEFVFTPGDQETGDAQLNAVQLRTAQGSAAGTASAPAADAGMRINVRDFGATADGVTDDGPAIHSALVKAMSLGAGGELFFPNGTYKITHSIDISGAKGLTLQGNLKTLVVMNNAAQAMLRIHDCQDLAVRQMSFDRSPMPVTQGTIDAVDADGLTCDVTIDPGYDGFDAPQFAKGGTFSPFVYPDSDTYQLDRYPSPFVSATSLGDRRWRISFKEPKPQPAWTGKKFVFWAGGQGHCLEVDGLHDALFEDIHYCGGGSAGLYMGNLAGTIAFRRFVIGPPVGSDRLFAECGGAQIFKIRGKLIFESCDFSKIDDDGLDILGTWTRVVDQSDPRTLHLQSSAGIQAGDHIQIWDWKLKTSRTEAVVRQVNANPDQTVTVTLDHDVKAERVGAGDGQPFGEPANADGIDRVIDLDDMSEQTVIRDCSFQVFRAKCLNLKANNCLIENCHFYGSYQPAISAAPEWHFEEGPTVRHLVIRNNTFQTCNHSNIEIGPDDSPPPAPSRDTVDVLIEGNHFEDYGALPSVFAHYYPIGNALRVQNAKDVVIRNNDFGDPAATAPSGVAKVIAKNSDHVVIENNINLPEAEIEKDNVSP